MASERALKGSKLSEERTIEERKRQKDEKGYFIAEKGKQRRSYCDPENMCKHCQNTFWRKACLQAPPYEGSKKAHNKASASASSSSTTKKGASGNRKGISLGKSITRDKSEDSDEDYKDEEEEDEDEDEDEDDEGDVGDEKYISLSGVEDSFDYYQSDSDSEDNADDNSRKSPSTSASPAQKGAANPRNPISSSSTSSSSSTTTSSSSSSSSTKQKEPTTRKPNRSTPSRSNYDDGDDERDGDFTTTSEKNSSKSKRSTPRARSSALHHDINEPLLPGFINLTDDEDDEDNTNNNNNSNKGKQTSKDLSRRAKITFSRTLFPSSSSSSSSSTTSTTTTTNSRNQPRRMPNAISNILNRSISYLNNLEPFKAPRANLMPSQQVKDVVSLQKQQRNYGSKDEDYTPKSSFPSKGTKSTGSSSKSTTGLQTSASSSSAPPSSTTRKRKSPDTKAPPPPPTPAENLRTNLLNMMGDSNNEEGDVFDSLERLLNDNAQDEDHDGPPTSVSNALPSSPTHSSSSSSSSSSFSSSSSSTVTSNDSPATGTQQQTSKEELQDEKARKKRRLMNQMSKASNSYLKPNEVVKAASQSDIEAMVKLLMEVQSVDMDLDYSVKDETCPMCFSDFSNRELEFCTPSCSHRFCSNCINLHCKESFNNSILVARCLDGGPKGGCSNVISLERFIKAVGKEAFYNKASTIAFAILKKESAASNSSNSFSGRSSSSSQACVRVYCGAPKCEALLVIKKSHSRMVAKVRCPTCHVDICTKCRYPYHEGISCEANSGKVTHETIASVMSDEKGVYYSRRCPGCQNRISKNEECNHIHCTHCFTHFCWVCGVKMRDGTYRREEHHPECDFTNWKSNKLLNA